MGLFCGRSGFMRCVFVPLVVVALSDAKSFPKEKACSTPDLPAHVAYLCLPPLCQGPEEHGLFESSTVLEFFCKSGYSLASQPALAICQEGKWSWIQDVTCQPQGTSMAHPQNSLLTAASMSIIAGVALTLLAFLVTVHSCVLLRKRPSVCHCHSDHYEIFEDLDTMGQVAELDAVHQSDRSVDSLPSYEEVVCGHLENPLPHDDWDLECWVPFEEVLVQSESHHLAEENPDSPPPSYQDALAMAVGEGSGDGSGEGGPGREQGMTDPNGTFKSWVPGKMDFSVSIEF